MGNMSELEYVELFHLVFLGHLGPKMDKRLYAVKGGCNLRFFHGSCRFSEDVDLDVAVVAKETLRKKVGGILRSGPFAASLRSQGMRIAEVSEPKQTETVQRWKIGMDAEGISTRLRTRIEFSRRGLDEGRKLEPILPAVASRYRLQPLMVGHYVADTALRQKLSALRARGATQARDVFDIDLLLSAGASAQLPEEQAREAREAAFSIPFEQFKSQVLGYVASGARAAYDSRGAWEDMLLRVATALEKMENAPD